MQRRRSTAARFCFQDDERGFQHRVGIERDAIDALLDEELRELGVVARSLPADADFAALRATGRDDLGDHLFHCGIPFIENGRDDFAVAVHAEDELREVVGADAETVEDVAELLMRITLLGISHIT